MSKRYTSYYEDITLIQPKFALIAERSEDNEPDSYITFCEPDYLEEPWLPAFYEGWAVVSVTYWEKYELRCVLTEEGEVNLFGPGGEPDHYYQIPGAGLWNETAQGRGFVSRVRIIGDGLYVCGYRRQVYRFTWDGKDLASGQWQDVAGPMKQEPLPDPPDDMYTDTGETREEVFDSWLESRIPAIDFVDINGLTEDDIYTVGHECWHYDGRTWCQLALPTDEFINVVKPLSREQVVMVGENGTLLFGNARDGFVDRSRVEDNQSLQSVEWYNDRFYLGSNFGLLVYNPARGIIEPCQTGLNPEVKDAHTVVVKGGMLWSIGRKDLVYYDGQKWTRVDHPYNRPIRAKGGKRKKKD